MSDYSIIIIIINIIISICTLSFFLYLWRGPFIQNILDDMGGSISEQLPNVFNQMIENMAISEERSEGGVASGRSKRIANIKRGLFGAVVPKWMQIALNQVAPGWLEEHIDDIPQLLQELGPLIGGGSSIDLGGILEQLKAGGQPTFGGSSPPSTGQQMKY